MRAISKGLTASKPAAEAQLEAPHAATVSAEALLEGSEPEQLVRRAFDPCVSIKSIAHAP